MTNRPIFDQDIPGFLTYRDNGDGTFTPRVASGPTAGTIVHFAANAPGAAVWGSVR